MTEYFNLNLNYGIFLKQTVLICINAVVMEHYTLLRCTTMILAVERDDFCNDLVGLSV